MQQHTQSHTSSEERVFFTRSNLEVHSIVVLIIDYRIGTTLTGLSEAITKLGGINPTSD
jgi:hypothetical protein